MPALNLTRPTLTKQIPLATIDAIVSEKLGPARVQGNAQPAVFNRQIAMYLAKHVGGWSTSQIGRFYNGRDHSTVCYAVRRIEVLRELDSELDVLLAGLTHALRSEQESSTDLHAGLAGRRPNAFVLRDPSLLDELADRVADRILAAIAHRSNAARLAVPVTAGSEDSPSWQGDEAEQESSR